MQKAKPTRIRARALSSRFTSNMADIYTSPCSLPTAPCQTPPGKIQPQPQMQPSPSPLHVYWTHEPLTEEQKVGLTWAADVMVNQTPY